MGSLRVQKTENQMVIQIAQHLEVSNTDEVLLWLRDFKDTAIQSIQFQFSGCMEIAPAAYPGFGRVKIELNRQGLSYQSSGMSARLISQLQSDGVFGLFRHAQQPSALVRPGAATASSGRKLHDVQYLNMMIEELLRALHTINVEAKVSKPFIKKAPVFEGVGVVGVLALSAAELRGSICLCVPERFAVLLRQGLLGVPMVDSEADDEALELLEDLTAAFFDAIRARFLTTGLSLAHAVPSVLVGRPSGILQTLSTTTLVIPFTSNYGDVFLEVVLA